MSKKNLEEMNPLFMNNNIILQVGVESFLIEKEDLVATLKEIFRMREKELVYSTVTINEMETVSKMLIDMINNVKFFGDKCGIGYSEGFQLLH